MSNIALASNVSGTGTFTIASPNSNTNRTLNLPDATGTLVTTDQLTSVVPAGTIIHCAMSTVPSGFLKANGALVSRTAYSSLFAAIGTTYGVGDGSTTFALPDLRGEFIRGWDDGRGVDSGRSIGSAQSASGISDRVSADGVVYFTNSDSTSTGPTVFYFSIGGANTSSTYHYSRPRNVALLACIKF